MKVFTKISYDSVSSLINKSCANWDGSDHIEIDETKLTIQEFELVKRYLTQEGYIENV